MHEIYEVSKNRINFKAYSQDAIDNVVNWNFWRDGFPTWEPETFDIFDIFLSKDKDFLDIGAWVGPTSLYASFIARDVVAVEPDPIAFKFLSKNIELNEIYNITTINKALADDSSVYINPKICFGSSMSVVSDSPVDGGVEVDGISMSELLIHGDYSLIKVDIEGYEQYMLPKYINEILDTPLYLSIHTEFYEYTDSLLHSLSLYNFIYDSQLNRIDIDQILVPDFPTYLFLPRSIDEYR